MIHNLRVIIPIALAAGLVLSLLTIMPALVPASALGKISTVQQQSDHVDKFRISGKIAQAQWYLDNEEEQTFTDVFISLVDAATKPDGLYPEASIVVFIFEYKLVEECVTYPDGEVCYYEYEPITEFYGFGEPQKSEYNISSNLRSASVDGFELSGYDYVAGEERTVTLDASWTGQGSLLKQKRSYSETNEDYVLAFKAMGIGRDATATAQVSGDINLTLDEASYLDGDASILRAREGYMIRTVS